MPNNLIKNYLSDRTQYVQLGSAKSSIKSINIGVPQGSILGPLLFLFYINDLPNISNALQILLFADDTILSMPGSNFNTLTSTINTHLDTVKTWTISNRLTVNVNKTQVINFSNRCVSWEDDNRIVMDSNHLEYVNSCRYLGIHIDNRLTFSEHINFITGKIARSTGILYKLRFFIPPDARLNFYYAFAYPYLSYCVLVWGGTYDSHLKNLIVQQKKIIRVIAGVPAFSHTSHLFHSLGLLKFNDIYKYHVSLHMHKFLGSFQCRHSLNTRNRNLAVPSFHRLTLTQHAVSFRGPRIWNELPIYIRKIENIHKFKKELKLYFLSSYI